MRFDVWSQALLRGVRLGMVGGLKIDALRVARWATEARVRMRERARRSVADVAQRERPAVLARVSVSRRNLGRRSSFRPCQAIGYFSYSL